MCLCVGSWTCWIWWFLNIIRKSVRYGIYACQAQLESNVFVDLKLQTFSSKADPKVLFQVVQQSQRRFDLVFDDVFGVTGSLRRPYSVFHLFQFHHFYLERCHFNHFDLERCQFHQFLSVLFSLLSALFSVAVAQIQNGHPFRQRQGRCSGDSASDPW